MNHLDKLISQYCPNGVQWGKLNKLGRFYGGLTGKSKTDFVNGNAKFISYKNIYNNPALDMDIQEYVCIKQGESQNIVQFGDILFTGSSETPDECGLSSVVNIQLKDNLYLNSFCFGFRMSEPKLLNIDFAKHLFRSNELRQQIAKTADGVTRFNVSKERFGNISIPLPPLPVQQEIVRILDSMTALIANLDSEIAARRQQYAHYRDFWICKQNYKQVPFASLGELVRGKRFVRTDIVNSGIPCIHYGDMYTHYGVIAYDTPTYLHGDIVSKMRYAQKGDVVIVGAGENNEDIGVGVAWMGDKPVAVHDACYILSHKQNATYISYYLRTAMYHNLIKKIVVDGKICSFPLSRLGKITIPLPPISVQQEIVAKLDAFESLLANLRRERTLRQQQYEYYRERLLSFKETK